jgi:hypothetical protein
MTYEELVKRLKEYGMSVNAVCVDWRNRHCQALKSWLVKQHNDRQGSLSEMQTAFFTAYMDILRLENENQNLKERLNNNV